MLGALALPAQAADHGEFTGLGFLGTGTQSYASGVSADGAVVVGTSHNEAFRWTQATAMQSVADWLAGAGISTAGWTLSEATGVNGNGNVVVGNDTTGGNNHAPPV